MGEIYNMTFRRDFYEKLNKHIDGVVYFANRYKLKPFGIGSIRLKLLGFLDFMLLNVLYLLEL